MHHHRLLVPDTGWQRVRIPSRATINQNQHSVRVPPRGHIEVHSCEDTKVPSLLNTQEHTLNVPSHEDRVAYCIAKNCGDVFNLANLRKIA